MSTLAVVVLGVVALIAYVMFALIVAQIFGANKGLEFDEEGIDSPLRRADVTEGRRSQRRRAGAF